MLQGGCVLGGDSQSPRGVCLRKEVRLSDVRAPENVSPSFLAHSGTCPVCPGARQGRRSGGAELRALWFRKWTRWPCSFSAQASLASLGWRGPQRTKQGSRVQVPGSQTSCHSQGLSEGRFISGHTSGHKEELFKYNCTTALDTRFFHGP